VVAGRLPREPSRQFNKPLKKPGGAALCAKGCSAGLFS
jgi:hypothetical protein